MARIRTAGGGWLFMCAGCHSLHKLDARFVFNYSFDRPTFKQDIILRTGPFGKGHPFEGRTLDCHSRIQNGIIHYLPTCTHDLKGQNLGLQDFEEFEAMFRAMAESQASAAARAKALEDEKGSLGQCPGFQEHPEDGFRCSACGRHKADHENGRIEILGAGQEPEAQ